MSQHLLLLLVETVVRAYIYGVLSYCMPGIVQSGLHLRDRLKQLSEGGTIPVPMVHLRKYRHWNKYNLGSHCCQVLGNGFQPWLI